MQHLLQRRSWRRLWSVCFTITLSLFQVAAAATAASTGLPNSIFSEQYQYPQPWWVISGSQVNALANSALSLRLDTADPNAFAQDVILGLARNQRIQASSVPCSAVKQLYGLQAAMVHRRYHQAARIRSCGTSVLFPGLEPYICCVLAGRLAHSAGLTSLPITLLLEFSNDTAVWGHRLPKLSAT